MYSSEKTGGQVVAPGCASKTVPVCRRRARRPSVHKVLSEGCESGDNHWCAVVVQDLASQWIQSHSCNTKSSHETEKKFVKVLGAVTQTQIRVIDNSLEFGKACED